MSLRHACCLVVAICVSATFSVDAQKGGKPPKQVDRPGTAVFRCNGPTAATRTPPGTPCGPFVDGMAPDYPDGITGDGSSYIGVGETVGGSGAFLRFDGEFQLIVRPTNGRTVFLNFESMLSAPLGQKNFNFADPVSIGLTTNVILPGTQSIAANGILSIPVSETWPTRITSNWTDTYGVRYTIRFNPTDYPGSDHAWVTRDSQNAWTIFATDVERARLVAPPVESKGKPTGPADEGTYIMPFQITFTVP